MADGNINADVLRKQITFLSNLINSHKNDKTDNHNAEKAALKTGKNSRQNMTWSRWKKQAAVVKQNGSPVIAENAKSSRRKDDLQSCSSKTINQAQSIQPIVGIPSSKFTYRRKPLQTSVTLPRNKTKKSEPKADLVLATKRKQLTLNKANQVIYNRTLNQSTNSTASTVLKQQNKYKLNRKHNLTSTVSPSPSISKPITSKHVVTSVQKTKMFLPSKLKVSPRDIPKNPNGNLQWLANQKKTNKKSDNKRHVSVKAAPSITAVKGSKLKWRRKSASQSNLPVIKKTKLIKNHKTQTGIPTASKLKWRRKSITHTLSSKKSTLDVKRPTRTRLVHKSRYSIKRMDSTQAKLLRRNSFVSTHGGVQNRKKKYEVKNKSFVARRLKYIANGALTLSTHTTNNCRRTVNIRGKKYIIRSGGKTLQKIPVTKHDTTLSSVNPQHFKLVHDWRNSSRFTLNRLQNRRSNCDNFTNRTLQRQNSLTKYKNKRANKILQKTIQNAQASLKKDNKSKQYCMFYNKFGKCTKQKQGICPYIHDPSKIAVCTRFLRGTCQQMDGTCPFSHKLDKEKMPICQYFLKGKCTRDDCPYSHVNVGQKAAVCQDFLNGYCAQGYKCKKKHVLECEEFNTTGQCPNGKKCKLIHRKKTRKRYYQELSEEDASEESPVKIKKQRNRSSDGFLPLEDSTLNDSDKEEEQVDRKDLNIEPTVSLKIRPKFSGKNDV